ncbi:WG repeat-containing protein, partial [Psychrobacter sp. AOP29-E1-4]|uniref:WG repeat-containing protein n=1 Tax=Psychrobacter sp. AOP29-E1-4 TaxID=3457703 RepID=UPI004035F8A8
MNTKGEVLLPFEYDNIDMFNEGFASVQRNGKRGFINEQFVEVIECQYDEGYDFNEGLANVKLNNKWG